MRVADKMIFNQVKHNLQKNRADMADLQNKAATLKKITKPSDDPLAATRVLGYRTESAVNSQFLKTATQAKALLDFSDQSLAELTDVLIRAKELVLGQVNDGSGDANSRRVVAEEIKQLERQAIQVGNRKLGERYLFGGYQTVNAPFSSEGDYKGDDGEIRMPINKDTWMAANIPGSKIFHGKQVLDHQIGDESIVEPRTVTQLQKAEKYELDLKDPEKKEEVQQVQMRGPASVPPGSENGEDSSASSKLIRGDGLSSQNVEGVNIFDVLKKVHISMKADDKNGLQDTLEDIDEGLKQVVLARAELGARISSLDANVESLTKLNIDAKEVASQLEDADQFEVITDITKTDGTLKATLQTSGKLIQPSLLDFLR